MVRLLEDRRRPVDLRPRVDQIDRVELVPAVVALVAAGRLEPADRAGALDVAVRERMTGRGGERSHRRLLEDVALLVERAKHVLDDPVVVGRRRACEQVVREPEVEQVFPDEAAVAVGSLTRRQPLLIGGDHDRRSVLVCSADHEDGVAAQPVIPGCDVRRDAEPGDMPEMPRAARVGPGDGDENALWGAVREGDPPERARTATSYGGAEARPDAAEPDARACLWRARRQAARGRREPSRSAARASIYAPARPASRAPLLEQSCRAAAHPEQARTPERDRARASEPAPVRAARSKRSEPDAARPAPTLRRTTATRLCRSCDGARVRDRDRRGYRPLHRMARWGASADPLLTAWEQPAAGSPAREEERAAAPARARGGWRPEAAAAARGGGRSVSGSRYPFGSAVSRMPRYTYGSVPSTSPVGPIVPTMSPSETCVPVVTAIDPRWTSVTE